MGDYNLPPGISGDDIDREMGDDAYQEKEEETDSYMKGYSDRDIFCAHCGKRCEYMGIKDVRIGKAQEKIYNRHTGKPLRESWWRCPESKRFWSGFRHSTYTRPCNR